MLTIAVALTMIAGLIGVVAPFLPGLVIMWVAALVYGVVDDFGTTGVICFAIISALAVAGEAAGYFLPGRAANNAGAPASSIAVGALAGCVGFFVIPVFGFVLGGILGIFVAEFLRTKDTRPAWSTTVTTLVGFGIGALVQLAFAVAIIITWLVWAFSNGDIF